MSQREAHPREFRGQRVATLSKDLLCGAAPLRAYLALPRGSLLFEEQGILKRWGVGPAESRV